LVILIPGLFAGHPTAITQPPLFLWQPPPVSRPEQGNGMPLFSAPMTVTLTGRPISLIIVDLNGDYQNDLAAVDNATGLWVFLNRSAPPLIYPQFEKPVGFSIPDRALHGLAAGDLNADGRPDLAVSNYETVSVLLNETEPGSDQPAFAGQVSFATAIGSMAIAIGDFNLDGKPDLATASDRDQVSVLFNTTPAGGSLPSFAAHAEFSTFAGTSPPAFNWIGLQDFNNDGRLDIVAITSDSKAALRLNTTAPGASAPAFSGPWTPWAGGFNHLAIGADFNRDGKADLAGWLAGAQNFGAVLNMTSPGAGAPSFGEPGTVAVDPYARDAAAIELNGDYLPDLAVTNSYSYTISILINRTAPGASAPQFSRKINFPAAHNVGALAAGDLNQDGWPDLAAGSDWENTITILINLSGYRQVYLPVAQR
jgi:hypothetical protein